MNRLNLSKCLQYDINNILDIFIITPSILKELCLPNNKTYMFIFSLTRTLLYFIIMCLFASNIDYEKYAIIHVTCVILVILFIVSFIATIMVMFKTPQYTETSLVLSKSASDSTGDLITYREETSDIYPQ